MRNKVKIKCAFYGIEYKGALLNPNKDIPKIKRPTNKKDFEKNWKTFWVRSYSESENSKGSWITENVFSNNIKIVNINENQIKDHLFKLYILDEIKDPKNNFPPSQQLRDKKEILEKYFLIKFGNHWPQDCVGVYFLPIDTENFNGPLGYGGDDYGFKGHLFSHFHKIPYLSNEKDKILISPNEPFWPYDNSETIKYDDEDYTFDVMMTRMAVYRENPELAKIDWSEIEHYVELADDLGVDVGTLRQNLD